MRTLHRYILSNFLVTFLMAMAVLTFVMTVGLVFSSMKFIARGMSPQLFLSFLWQSLPGTLSYSVPIAALVASLLVFSRLSSDSEISAMRSCGVSLWSINLRVKQPLPDGRMRDIRAAEAVIRQPADEPAWLDMRDVGIRTTSHEAGPAPAAETGRRGESIDEMRAKTWKLPLSVFSDDDSSSTRLDEEGRLRRRTKDLPTWALLRDILSAADKPPVDRRGEVAIARAKVEVVSRAVLAAACLCFVLIGIPLGIQSHRRQSSVGLAISLGVAGVFYLFCITGQSLAKHPALHAHWIVVAPMAVCLVLGAILISRNN